jgi:predicted amidophosphoribosyltransferase
MNFLLALPAGFLAGVAQTIWPVSCPVCGRLGSQVCDGCLEGVMEEIPAFCMECGAGAPCGFHPGGPIVRAATSYAGVNRDIVRVMKYRSGRRVARMMGRLLAERFHKPDADFLVPVPLHKSSDRDYNQAEHIARGAGDVWGVPVASPLKWKRAASRQATKQGAAERTLPPDAITGRPMAGSPRVLIVDDVYTSGSTIRASASALGRSGAVAVGAMVWSRSGGSV